MFERKRKKAEKLRKQGKETGRGYKREASGFRIILRKKRL